MARNIWAYDRTYDICRYYVDFCTRTQFSRMWIRGLEKVPKDGAVIFAPNHVAALMDPLLMLKTRHSAIGFGARSDIFRQPTVAKFLNWLRILPLARERNGLQEVAKNFETMDDIVDCLRHDVPFCMYAEGTHRPERGLLPIKKGVFRIAKKALEDLQRPVYVVPVGLDYEFFFRVKGRVSLKIGDPIDVGEYLATHQDITEAEQYRELCEMLKKGILDNLDQLPERRHNFKFIRGLALLALLPLWLVLGVLSAPIWVTAELILSRMEDKAWTNTVYFVVRFFLPVLWPFHGPFALFTNYYRNFIKDLR